MKQNVWMGSIIGLAVLLQAGSVFGEPQEPVQTVVMLERQVQFGERLQKEELYQAISTTAKSNAEKTFKSYLADPIPQNITELKGDSLHWLGFKATLTFRSDPEAFKFLATGYEPVEQKDLPQAAKGWFDRDVTAISGLLCYRRSDDLNEYYLLWDEASGTVYFKGQEE